MPNAFTKRMLIRMRRNGYMRADKGPRISHELPGYLIAPAHNPPAPSGEALVRSRFRGHGGRRIDRADNGARLLPDLTCSPNGSDEMQAVWRSTYHKWSK